MCNVLLLELGQKYDENSINNYICDLIDCFANGPCVILQILLISSLLWGWVPCYGNLKVNTFEKIPTVPFL